MLAFLTVAVPSYAFKFTGLPWEASQPYMETGGRNYLPWNAVELEQKYGIDVYVYRFPAKTKIDPERMATAYYDTLTKTPEDKVLLIWVSGNAADSIIMASDPIKRMLPEGALEMLQKEVLRPYMNKWYVSEQRIYSKILGTVIYLLQKKDGASGGMALDNERYINIDDALYRISMTQPFYDLIRLFNFEPVTFCTYFPFLMYMFLVRLMGMRSGKAVFLALNIAWLAMTVFVFVLIFNRMNIIFPELVKIVSLILGFSAPLYFSIYIMYRNRIEAAAYSYLYDMTGGFGAGTDFGGAK